MKLRDMTPLQHRVLRALDEGATIAAAARRHNIHRTTIHHWCRTRPSFRHAVEGIRLLHAEVVREQCQESSPHALAVIRELLGEPEVSPSVRLRAAQFLLNLSVSPARPNLHQEIELFTDTLIVSHDFRALDSSHETELEKESETSDTAIDPVLDPYSNFITVEVPDSALPAGA
jgi:transposase-like protein